MGISGASTATLTVEQMPRHSHAITDLGHTHGASDRGHSHDLQMDSHTHEAQEDPDNKHTHAINDPGHFHGDVSVRGGRVSGSGANRYQPGGNTATTTETTGIVIEESPDDITLIVDSAEVSGSALMSSADIRVHKARSNISIDDNGDGASFSILNPVFGVNYLVKT